MIRVRVLLLAVCLAASGLLTACGGGNPQVSNDTCPDTALAGGASPYYPEPGTNGTPVGQQIPQMPHTHVQPPAKVHYEHNPPTSGCHYNLGLGTAPLSPGVYVNAVAPEYWVHNLEHGYIVVVYHCPSGCPADVLKLRQWYATQGADRGLASTVGDAGSYAKSIVIPYAQDFGHKYAVMSWDWYDGFDNLDTTPSGELQKFYDNHVGNAPESLSAP
jgi:uncharacterized protein DUF3105